MSRVPASSAGRDPRRLRALLTVLPLALVTAAPALLPLARGELFSHRDVLTFFLPMKIFLGEWLAAGVLPLWNPHTECGLPFLANLQSQVLYPPNTLLSLLPPAACYDLYVAFHLAAAACGVYAWARAYGVRPAAAFVGGVAFGLGDGLAGCGHRRPRVLRGRDVDLTMGGRRGPGLDDAHRGHGTAEG